MNTVCPESLPHGVTPWEAWFGRPLITWSERAAKIAQNAEARQAHQLDSDDSSALDTSDLDEFSTEEINSEAEEQELSKLSQRIKEHQKLVAQRMIRKKGGASSLYHSGDIMLLAIPKKNRLNTEATRLPCKVRARVRKVPLR